MTQRISKAEKDKVVSLLAQYLAGRSEVFQNKVYELVIRYGWDVNDPSFAILLATGQMETILESFPEQFEALFLRLMQESQQQLIGHRRWFEERQSELKDYVQGLEAQQSQSIAVLQENIEALNQGLEEQRQWHLNALNKALEVAQNHRTHIFEEVKTRLQLVEPQLIQQTEVKAYALVKETTGLWRKLLYRDVIWRSGAAGATIFLVGFLAGIFVYQNLISHLTDSYWATKLWGWNQDQYAACIDANRTTCNFRIIPPE